MMRGSGQIFCWCIPFLFFGLHLRQHRTIPALRLKHRSGSCGTASAAPRSPYRHLELCGIALRRFSSCFGFQYLQRSGTVKTVPYRMFWGTLLTCKISVGRCARRRVSEARLTGNARQFAKQTRSCSCKTHWVLHCSPSHFRKLKCDLLARNPATAARRLLGRRWMPSSRRGETLPTAHYILQHP